MADTSVLVVEDESVVAMDIKHRSEGLGYKVLGIATTGEEAIEKTAETRPDLVLMDIVLKGKMDGVQAAQEIGERFDIPVVYLTAYSDEKTLGRAKLTGPFGYIIKPFEDRELHSAIEVALYKHKMDSKLRVSEERYRTLFEMSPDPILLIDSDGKIIYQNNRADIILELSIEKTRGKSFTGLGVLNEEEMTKFSESFSSVLKNEKIAPFEIQITAENGQILYFELQFAPLKIKGNIFAIQIIGHDVTGLKEAEKHRVELIKEKARAELYGFVVSAVPVFASSIPPQLRNTIIRNFADRFEKNVKPGFEEEMERMGYFKNIKEGRLENPKEVFDAYISWVSELLASLDIKTEITFNGSNNFMEFLTFPWIEEAKQNPIFSLIFRAMIMRSFTWTGLKGNVSQISSFFEGSNTIKFEFYLAELQ
ncbi:MAG: response regulator [Euryarchaeota archaeon]|nr:response regulator [Euryarchaeota archaeon]